MITTGYSGWWDKKTAWSTRKDSSSSALLASEAKLARYNTMELGETGGRLKMAIIKRAKCLMNMFLCWQFVNPSLFPKHSRHTESANVKNASHR